jgi:hypothetical protein
MESLVEKSLASKTEEYLKEVENKQRENKKKIISIKAVLKEEEPQKLTRVIEKIESGKEKIDEYVARITGVNRKIVTTTRNWYRILERIILDEGREVLELALEELEQELQKEVENKNQEVKIIGEEENKVELNLEKEKVKQEMKKETKLENSDILSTEEKEKEEDVGVICNENSISIVMQQEVEVIKKRLALGERLPIEILFGTEQNSTLPSLDTNNKEIVLPRVISQIEQTPISTASLEILDLSLCTKEEIFTDAEECKTIQVQNAENYAANENRNKQGEYKRKKDFERRSEPLEASIWAPKEETCENKGLFKAKIFAATVPGDSKDIRVKFVRNTLPRSSHIHKIEESFIKGNAWIIITFDCFKGFDLLKTRIRKKEIEWYRVIFDEIQSNQIDTKIKEANSPNWSLESNKGNRIGENKKLEVKERRLSYQSEKTSSEHDMSQDRKGKNRDFLWITLWDLPLDYSNQEIRRLLKYFGNTEEVITQKNKFSQIAEVKLHIRDKEQENKLRANWAVGLENGKLARLTIGNANFTNLKEREGYRATLTNIPSEAQEALLLRAIQYTGAKSVYIPYNSNRNPSHIAKVFFRTREDMEKAISKNMYYYNTRLYWKEKSNNIRDYRIEQAPKRENRKDMPYRETRDRNPTHRRYIEESTSTKSRSVSRDKRSREQVLSRDSNIIPTAIDRVLDRLEALEEKWGRAQRTKDWRFPYRS